MTWFRNRLFGATVQFAMEIYALSMSPSSISSSSTTTAAAIIDDPYKSSSFIGHSLWMVPKNGSDAKTAYSQVVADMATELGTFQFLPHITLVAAMEKGEEDAIQRTKTLATELAPYSFEIDEISYRDAYFQCVYAKMKRTDAVVHANKVARQFFPERQADPEYMPHLSLVYGDFDENTKQNEIIPKLQTFMTTRQGTTTTTTTASTERRQYSEAIRVIPVDAIEVWSTQGDVKDWYRVATIPLTGGG